MSQEFDINGSFEVRRMSSSSFAIITIYFLAAFVFLTIYIFYQSTLMVLISCLFFVVLGVYNATKKHNTDEIFIEIDATGIWVHNREITTWNNYKKSYINVKYDSDYENYTNRDLQYNNNRLLQKIINIEFYKNGKSGYFIHQLFFNGSEDKVEDEVMDAIEFYYNHKSRNNVRLSI